MNELEILLRERIASDGPLTFAEYQDAALYHPELGYYADHERSGWRGHFLTSAELDPAFGALWAVGFRRVWEWLGRPESFELIEVGPGEGGFANSVLGVLEGDFADALTYRLVERVSALAERQTSLLSTYGNVVWSSSIDELTPVAQGAVMANEVLDNLPVHLLEYRGDEFVELYVQASDSGLEFVSGPVSSSRISRLLDGAELDPSEGQRLEVAPEAADFVRSCAGAVQRGAVFLVDYGVTWRELADRHSGTLVSYSDAGADDRVLGRPGEKDITSHTNWDVAASTLRAAGFKLTGPTPQREVLKDFGLVDLQESLARQQRALTAEGRGVEAVRALSRRQALGVLSDPHGLGGLGVLRGRRGA
ncbi:SAM-dependent methyltransferase [soil metagenome]